MTTLNQKSCMTGITSKTTYECSVISRAVERAGKNPHLKGHIHEIMVKDVKNLRNVFNGSHTELTKSTTAKTVDLVTKNGGKVVERLQLKDTLSQSGIDKTVKQVLNGQYRSTQLIGTRETTELVNKALEKAGSAKKMTSSGVSSKTTTTLAQRAGASGSGTLGNAVLQSAKTGGALGAGIGAGIEVASGIVGLVNGQRDLSDVALSTIKAGAKGYVTGAAATAAVTATGPAVLAATTAVAGAGTAATVITFAAPIAVAMGVGWMASSLWDAIFD
ncbi:hypothetical protein [Candidatus Methylomicrobium oryzae]|uniref:hypothetical protein n=1 Tax=Candidatus Methylomicrobium oryzae TaxID=2802053 RepID=UPI001922EF91|nr:hypothetical protein [Methylomicrobium sp. RS1]MBL1266007.1 hypothetical protein [Methylomicrobium sp. RS1]